MDNGSIQYDCTLISAAEFLQNFISQDSSCREREFFKSLL